MRNFKCLCKSIVVLTCYAFNVLSVSAQESLPKHALQIVAGYSEHGSGDMKGIVTGVEYIHFISKKLFLNHNIRNTINNQKHEIIVHNLTSGTTTDASIRFTTAGVQLGTDIGYSFLRNNRISVSTSLGVLFRYQSASNGSDGYSLYSEPATGLPLILVGYDNHTPQNTFAVGGLLQLQLDIRVSKHFYVAVIPRFQTDTNGDAIVQYAIAIGRTFNSR